jgi:hypothetical protein
MTWTEQVGLAVLIAVVSLTFGWVAWRTHQDTLASAAETAAVEAAIGRPSLPGDVFVGQPDKGWLLIEADGLLRTKHGVIGVVSALEPALTFSDPPQDQQPLTDAELSNLPPCTVSPPPCETSAAVMYMGAETKALRVRSGPFTIVSSQVPGSTGTLDPAAVTEWVGLLAFINPSERTTFDLMTPHSDGRTFMRHPQKKTCWDFTFRCDIEVGLRPDGVLVWQSVTPDPACPGTSAAKPTP